MNDTLQQLPPTKKDSCCASSCIALAPLLNCCLAYLPDLPLTLALDMELCGFAGSQVLKSPTESNLLIAAWTYHARMQTSFGHGRQGNDPARLLTETPGQT